MADCGQREHVFQIWPKIIEGVVTVEVYVCEI